MAFRRPGAATAAAVLAIIYGSLFTLCGLCGLANVVAQGAMGNNIMAGNDPKQAEMQKALQDALERDAPEYQAYQIVTTIVSLIGSLLLLFAGIGLLYMRRWARTLALADCLVLVAVTLFQTVYVAVYVMPVVSQVFAIALPNAMPQGAAAPPPEALRAMHMIMDLMTVGAVVLNVVLVVYLLIIVFLLNQRHVRVAFIDPRQDDIDERRYEDERPFRGEERDEDQY